MRVLPLENDDVNECWISDRDRFAYDGLNSDERLLHPMVKRAGEWAEVDWPEALEAAAHGLKDVVARHGAEALGVLLAPNLTLEELHLAARPRRAGSAPTTSTTASASPTSARRRRARRGSACRSRTLAKLESLLLVGSTLRKEQPLLATRIREAAKKGIAVNVAARGQRRAADAGGAIARS